MVVVVLWLLAGGLAGGAFWVVLFGGLVRDGSGVVVLGAVKLGAVVFGAVLLGAVVLGAVVLGAALLSMGGLLASLLLVKVSASV